jgi:hypothetical protein
MYFLNPSIGNKSPFTPEHGSSGSLLPNTPSRVLSVQALKLFR